MAWNQKIYKTHYLKKNKQTYQQNKTKNVVFLGGEHRLFTGSNNFIFPKSSSNIK